MKRIKLLFTALFLTATCSLSAQGFFWGVVAGVSAPTTSVKNIGAGSVENITGFHGGLTVGFNLLLVELAPEIIYSNSTMQFKDAAQFGNAKVRTHSVEVPVLASVAIFGPLKVIAGPTFTLLSDAKATYEGGAVDNLGPIKSALGYAVGLRFKPPLVPVLKNFTFDVRYNGQFGSKTTLFGVQGTDIACDINSSSFSGTIGYRF